MNPLNSVTKMLNKEQNIYLFYMFIFSLATLHRLLLTDNAFNNFEIFRYSFFNLIQNNNLYTPYPDYYFDLFKYNPSFALLMAPFWIIPKTLGVLIWNLLNALLPVYATNQLPIKTSSKAFFSIFILIEMLTSVQNAQSNGLMLGLMLLVFVFIEKNKIEKAALMMVLGFFIKIFAVGVAIMLVFKAAKKKFAIWALTFGALIGISPALIIGFEPLKQQYMNWFQMLSSDKPHALNYSMMSFAERTLGIHGPQFYYLIAAFILLALPLVRYKYFSNFSWRLTYLAAVLIWVVVFNHKSESPTFVIATAGVAFWFIASKKNTYRWVLLFIVLIFTTLSSTDLFPQFVRENYMKPYAIKVLPCILLFFTAIYDLLFEKHFDTQYLLDQQLSDIKEEDSLHEIS